LQLHHEGCSDRSRWVDQAAYDRGWSDGRSGKDCQEDGHPYAITTPYTSGYRHGNYAHALEEVENVSWHDYYGG
jgi:hypothetical protein